ncbi:O-methyltransferase [Candidatus Chloroploca sp. M-50]|uniref:O-methyltransferase n=1 Tax=Candidatus Chloroploca mongolica TaxID=2528176 RepID=A0ABS4DFL7_9CHLR|nr:O-methyltransferase [Candidatus Chloroploca mongolica]MBP1468245.1 O-methyltransferase [Candidatus Chloroploca mongolica]
MTNEQWSTVDQYFSDMLMPPDTALEAALAASDAAGMPTISVSPSQGALLYLLARTLRAQRILELGTLGAYSSIWLGRALPPGGQMITLEADPGHAEVARTNLERAGLSTVVEVRVGPALTTLPTLAGMPLFDLVFIDADKANMPAYFRWARALTRQGGLIIADNVVRRGAVVDANSTDPNVQGVRTLIAALADDPGVRATALQTVGSKGYDGLALVLVTGEPLPPPR